ncbi:GNAT family N-acetyltransferase [Nonomuraea monospora]|uniref:GNAT family N-acetyltransferase n=1 Tax=Nonomuraea monospora TaxID=568818 RepID=A0ABN3CGZ3_9ACTN
MHIRPGTKDDAEQIAELHTRSWLTAYAEIMPASYLNASLLDERKAMWSARLAAETGDAGHGRCAFVAVEGGAVVGFAYLGVEGDGRVLLDNLHVQPERKQAGIGRRLVCHAFGWAAERHPGRTVYLEVLRDNAAAIGFYRRLGGQPTREFVERFPAGFKLPVVEYAWGADLVRLIGGGDRLAS